MKKNRLRIDKVRASRDGHEFHEAWAARKSLQLVMPTDELVGIAVEGLAPSDPTGTSEETAEIADLVLYYGKRPTFDAAHAAIIVQFKYSRSSQGVPYRASDAKKTIRKFAAALTSHKRKHGAKDVEKKLAFELITNRPIYSEFATAIDGLASGIALNGDAKKQAAQFTSACGFKGKDLAQFARKFRITGLAGTLRENKQRLSRVLADWSVAPDAAARARLGNIKQLLREKAGLAGEKRNVVTRTDVLDALELQTPEDLFPCPASFPEIGEVVEREQLSSLLDRIRRLDKPLLIHSEGGIGKTVFLQSLAKILGETHETVLFDCFGGGAYRAPEDARHLPQRGLIHIINNLACTGLCDPLLQVNANVEDLVKAFRARLTQAVATMQRGSHGKRLLLFIDAIDNAAEQAKDRDELAFPRVLLESFHHSGPVAGVLLVVSCRTYRRDISRGEIPCEEVELKPFSPTEAEKYLRDRIPQVTDTQIQVAHSRSGGNPRILEHLALSERGLLDPSEINNAITLDDLLKERIQKALGEAQKRGYKDPDISAFLAGLSVLPPPVPLDEYADAHGMVVSAVKSFAADLAPLLEQTRHGLMFRDEPTETLIREVYAAQPDTLRVLAENLYKKQGTSVYAASALPGLLQKRDDGKLLFELAFDDRFPAAITSAVGRQRIRYARLKAAVLHAARKKEFNHLVHLLLELSTLAAVNQRGMDYILANPELVIAAQDVDATRRLFETRTSWPGTRHARLTIASVLSGDLRDAYRHAVNADEWIHHFYRQNDEYRRDRTGPERLDIASIPLCLVAQDGGRKAAAFMKGWKDWYAYEVAEDIFTLLRQGEAMETISATSINRFLTSLKSQPGVLAGALSFRQFDNTTCRGLIGQLAKVCEKKKAIETSQRISRERDYCIEDGLLKAAAIAIAMKQFAEAVAIVQTISHERPRVWAFRDRFFNKDPYPFIIYTAVRCAVQRQSVTDRALLPQELVDIAARIPRGTEGDAFRKALKAELDGHLKSQKGLSDEKKAMSYETQQGAVRFINEQHAPLLAISRAFTATLSSGAGKGDKPFLALVDVWAKLRMKPEPYSKPREVNLFFDLLGREFLTFLLWARSDLNASSIDAFVTKVSADGMAAASTLIKIIMILAQRPDLQELAGKMAMKASRLIEREDEVSYRASLFAKLSRAIMPASLEETESYFRAGLEQMDAIGSGDYQFTHDLLLFAAELRGTELQEVDFHTLSNICELNMPADEEKFPWLAFARGLASTSGVKMLAKLARWDDRDKVSLAYTLLPYLTALIELDKIDPSVALGLLRLSDPAELYVCGTQQLAEVIVGKSYPNSNLLLTDLILQFQQNHRGANMPSSLATLHKLAEGQFGEDSEQAGYLSRAAPKFAKLRDENNNNNYRGTDGDRLAEKLKRQEDLDWRALTKIQAATDPTDEASMSQAIDALNCMQPLTDLKAGFFERLRETVRYGDRAQYLNIVARLGSLDIHIKLRELNDCKKSWGPSSIGLEKVFRDIAAPLIQIHADDFVYLDCLFVSYLKDISELSGIPLPLVALELVVIFAGADSHLPAAVWMGVAAIICANSKQGEGQIALKRLLNSGSAKLASTVVDGAWNAGLYPKGGEVDVAAGLVWLTLGSPVAANRWRGAHSIRSFARLGKWEVIDALIRNFHSKDAHPYQAPELPFYFLHARLWLLVAIARVAMDHPQRIAKYADELKAIAFDKNNPHVLLRHFAARALVACAGGGGVVLSEADANALAATNESPFPKKKSKEYADSFYHERGRPDSTPTQESEFHLDYDFDKIDVTSVSHTFGRPRWETKDGLTAWVRKYDPHITAMYENGGRSARRRELGEMTADYHTHGQQLGWHALFLVAGEFLAKYPVVQRTFGDDDPWHGWLGRELLTRNDGLWLADGVDSAPVDAQVNLYEKGKERLVLTGNREKLLALLNIDSSVSAEVVVAGDWSSADGIEIHITSALVSPRHANKLARQLSQDDPFHAWLPGFEGYEGGDEFSRSENEAYKPWIVWPSIEARFDETDLLGVPCAVRRLFFAKGVNAIGSLRAQDPFGRAWVDAKGRVVARSEAWGRTSARDDGASVSAVRLLCSSSFLKDVLLKRRAELLLLVKLRVYEKGFGSQKSQFWHTTAVIRIARSLDFEFSVGAINKCREVNY